MRVAVAIALAALCVSSPLASADSPRADETPFWPVGVAWSPAPVNETCSLADAAKPHGFATWDAQFTACVYRLADFDTCADDACLQAFNASATQALNCSYDGTDGTAREVEAYRVTRCVNARKIASLRYVPKPTPTAPQCTSAQQASWNAAYENSPEYTACLKALTTVSATRSCSDACQVLFRDSVGDAEECLFSSRAGDLTQHEWLKHRLVWCLTVRGESLKEEPLLSLRGTPSPAPTTPKPKPTTKPPLSQSSSGSGALEDGSVGSSSPSASNSYEEDSATGPPIDIASSADMDTSPYPVVSQPAPGSPTYGNTDSSTRNHHQSIAVAAVVVCFALMLSL